MTSPDDSSLCDDSQELASAYLRREVESLYDDYHERWRTSDENELFVDIAEAFRPSVGNLSINKELVKSILRLHEEVGTPTDLSDIPGFVQALTEHPIVREGLEIRLAHDAIASLAVAEARISDLLALIASRTLSPVAEAYLERATRLYLWGWELEAVVMCAASLEAAYSARFSDQEMGTVGISKTQDGYEAYQYERAALKLKVFDERQVVQARRVRRDRNDVVHKLPILDVPPRCALGWTAELLQCLFPTEAPPASPSND